MNLLLIAIGALCSLTCGISALQCYSCEGKNNHPCVENPKTAKIVTCSSNQQCYISRKEQMSSSGSFVSIQRGCGQSVGTVASSGNNYGVSANSLSCSTNLCNSGDGRQNFNVNDFINNFNIPNFSGSYPFNQGYPTGVVPGNAFNVNNYGFPGNYLFYPNYSNNAPRPDPFFSIITSALNNKWRNIYQNIGK